MKNYESRRSKPSGHYEKIFFPKMPRFSPNILSIDNQLIIKPQSPPKPTAAAML